MQSDDDESGNRRAPARAFSEKPPKAPAYEDPIDAEAREAESIDDRHRVIALLMAQGRWTKVKALQLANLWAVALKTVNNYACEANRLRKQIKGAGSLKNAAARTRDQLQAAYELAIAQGDAKAATMAARALGELQGAFPSKSTGKPEGPAAGAPAVPAQFSEFVDHPDLLRFWTLTSRRPTPAQKKAILEGVPVEEVIQQAKISLNIES